MCDQTIKPALLRVAWNDGWSARAAFQNRLLTAQVQPRTLDARAVAHHAVPLEDRRDLLFEEIRIRRGHASIMRHKSRADRAERQKPASPVSQAPPLHYILLLHSQKRQIHRQIRRILLRRNPVGVRSFVLLLRNVWVNLFSHFLRLQLTPMPRDR